MKSRAESYHEIVLELTEEQSRQIERTTGKLVTELQVEIVEVAKTPVKPLIPKHNHSIKEGETQ